MINIAMLLPSELPRAKTIISPGESCSKNKKKQEEDTRDFNLLAICCGAENLITQKGEKKRKEDKREKEIK